MPKQIRKSQKLQVSEPCYNTIFLEALIAVSKNEINRELVGKLDGFVQILENVKGIKIDFSEPWTSQLLKNKLDSLYPVYMGFILKSLLLSNTGLVIANILVMFPKSFLVKFDKSYHDFIKGYKFIS